MLPAAVASMNMLLTKAALCGKTCQHVDVWRPLSLIVRQTDLEMMRRGRRMSWPAPRRRLLPLAAPHAALSLLRLDRDNQPKSKGGGGGNGSCVRPFLRAHLGCRLFLRDGFRS